MGGELRDLEEEDDEEEITEVEGKPAQKKRCAFRTHFFSVVTAFSHK